MKSHHRPWLVLFSLIAMAALAGCRADGLDTRNTVEIVSIGDNATVFSSVYDQGPDLEDPLDDFIPVDQIEVTFLARANDNLVIEPYGPFGSVRFDSYDVYFGPNGGFDIDGDGTADIRNFSNGMGITIPTGGDPVTTGIVVMGTSDKVKDPLACLGPLGGACGAVTDRQYFVNTRVTFHGEEATSGEDISISRNIGIVFGFFNGTQE